MNKEISLYKHALANLAFQSAVERSVNFAHTSGGTFLNTHLYRRKEQMSSTFLLGRIYYLIDEGYHAFFPHNSVSFYRITDSRSRLFYQRRRTFQAEGDWKLIHFSSTIQSDQLNHCVNKSVGENQFEFYAEVDERAREVIYFIRKDHYVAHYIRTMTRLTACLPCHQMIELPAEQIIVAEAIVSPKASPNTARTRKSHRAQQLQALLDHCFDMSESDDDSDDDVEDDPDDRENRYPKDISRVDTSSPTAAMQFKKQLFLPKRRRFNS